MDVVDLVLDRPAVQAQHQAEGEIVLAAADVLLRQSRFAQRRRGQRRNVDLEQPVAFEAAVFEWVGGVAGFRQVGGRKGAGVGDDDAAVLDVGEVRLQRRRVHRDERVGRVAGGEHLPRAVLDLVARDAEQRAGRSANLGRIIRMRREAVARFRHRLREFRTGQLHAVAGVADESDHDAVQLLDRAHAAARGVGAVRHRIARIHDDFSGVSVLRHDSFSCVTRRGHRGRERPGQSGPNSAGRVHCGLQTI